MKDMTVETLNFIILCMGLLFVMAGIFLIVGKLAGKRPASIAVGVLMIAWGLLCGIPESRSWMLARATDLEHLLEAMWAGLDGDGRMLVYIFALWLMGAIVIMLDVEHEHVTSLRPGEHFYQLVVPCAGMALIIAGPNGWACFGTRILIAAALQ